MFKISLYNIFVHKQYYLNYSATWEIKSSPVAIDGLPVLTAYISKVFIWKCQNAEKFLLWSLTAVFINK